MRYGRYIPDTSYGQPRCLQGAYGCLPSGAWAINKNFHMSEPLVHPLPGSLLGCPLCGEGGALTRPPES